MNPFYEMIYRCNNCGNRRTFKITRGREAPQYPWLITDDELGKCPECAYCGCARWTLVGMPDARKPANKKKGHTP